MPGTGSGECEKSSAVFFINRRIYVGMGDLKDTTEYKEDKKINPDKRSVHKMDLRQEWGLRKNSRVDFR